MPAWALSNITTLDIISYQSGRENFWVYQKFPTGYWENDDIVSQIIISQCHGEFLWFTN